MDQEDRVSITRLEERLKALGDAVSELSKSIQELRLIVIIAYIVPIALFFLQQLLQS